MIRNIIGFWGYPHPDVIQKYKKEYPNAVWIDLDIDYNNAVCSFLPDAYCKIIKNIVSNAIFYKDELIVILAAVGKEKCDSGYFAAQILKQLGLNVEMTYFENLDYKKEPLISQSDLPLRQKFELITKSIVENIDLSNFKISKPKFGFWGVPPNDLSLLELFPDETHVFGWTRCVDAKTPNDIDLELFVDENIPTVFYTQAFCAKAQLAKYLANKYNGLYIDIDDNSTNSTKAKIEAFIKLR